MKLTFRNSILILLIGLFPIVFFGQVAPPPIPPPPPPGLPIDGGLWMLLIAGIGYGIKKIKK